MRIAMIIPGSGGGFYCENCFRDAHLFRALSAAGHEVITVPMYLPLPKADFGRGEHVFYGAVGLYMAESLPFMSRMPAWLERILDSRPSLALAARLSGSTDPEALASLTLSMLKGDDAYLSLELDKLVDWLRNQAKPDVVLVSNALLLSLCGRIGDDLGVPVAVSLQDEDSWIDELPKQAADEAWGILRAQAAAADLFLPVSAFYARFMSERLGVPVTHMRIVPIAVDVERYRPSSLSGIHSGIRSGTRSGPPVLGYLSRLSQRMGFGVIAEAFSMLKDRPGLRDLRLLAMGGFTGTDKPFLRRTLRALRRGGHMDSVTILPGLEIGQRVAGLAGLSALSVPSLAPEAFGCFLLEALASGVPLVQPATGGYKELIEATGGGYLVNDADPAGLARALEPLLRDPELSRSLGERGRAAVESGYSGAAVAARIASALEEAVRKGRKRP